MRPAFRSFCVSLGSLGLSLGRLGAPSGCLGTHNGAPWGCIGVPWGCLGTTLGHLELDVGMPGDHFGPYLTFGVRRNPHRKPMALKYRDCAQKQASWNLPGGIRRSRRNGPRTTVQDLPSTRAGHQDDVSFTNSLKLRCQCHAMLHAWNEMAKPK